MGGRKGRGGREGLKEWEGKWRKRRGRGEESGSPMFQTDRRHCCNGYHNTTGTLSYTFKGAKHLYLMLMHHPSQLASHMFTKSKQCLTLKNLELPANSKDKMNSSKLKSAVKFCKDVINM
jgi:hypothetical protein